MFRKIRNILVRSVVSPTLQMKHYSASTLQEQRNNHWTLLSKHLPAGVDTSNEQGPDVVFVTRKCFFICHSICQDVAYHTTIYMLEVRGFRASEPNVLQASSRTTKQQSPRVLGCRWAVLCCLGLAGSSAHLQRGNNYNLSTFFNGDGNVCMQI